MRIPKRTFLHFFRGNLYKIAKNRPIWFKLTIPNLQDIANSKILWNFEFWVNPSIVNGQITTSAKGDKMTNIILQFTGIGTFYVQVLHMEVTMVYNYQFAGNIISLASKLYWGRRLMHKNPCFCSKIRSMVKLPPSRLKWKNAIAIWYFNKIGLIWDFGGHTGLKQPQNLKLDFKSARSNSANSCLTRSVNFISGHSFKIRTYSES